MYTSAACKSFQISDRHTPILRLCSVLWHSERAGFCLSADAYYEAPAVFLIVQVNLPLLNYFPHVPQSFRIMLQTNWKLQSCSTKHLFYLTKCPWEASPLTYIQTQQQSVCSSIFQKQSISVFFSFSALLVISFPSNAYHG